MNFYVHELHLLLREANHTDRPASFRSTALQLLAQQPPPQFSLVSSANASTSSTTGDSTIFQTHGVTVNDGSFNLAGRDIHIHSSGEAKVGLATALRLIRNLRKVHLDILAKATPGTGVWLLKSDKFFVWLDPNGHLKILWGTGIPGAGKTVLAAIVIKELEARAEAAKGSICVAYIYIRYSESADLTVRGILEILVKQTVERHPICVPLAVRAYTRRLCEDTQPTEAELLQLLQQFTSVTAATFYVLDALDEAPDKLQLDLIRKLSSLNVRLFITSRRLQPSESRLPDSCNFSIVTQDHDLDLYIAQEIGRSPDLQALLAKAEPSLQEEIVSSAKRKCGGMFLHASLQLDALSQCASVYDVRQVVNGFPPKIEDVYLQTWDRICNQTPAHVSLAKAVLVWVLNAPGSMTIEELRCAVATSPYSYKFDRDRLVPGSTLIAICRGLVTFEEKSRLVRLVHYTAREILRRLLHDSFPRPHSHLAAVCVTHLAECGFQDAPSGSGHDLMVALNTDPLLAYAHHAWGFHAQNKAFPAFIGGGPSTLYDILSPLHLLALFALYNLPLAILQDVAHWDLNIRSEVEGLTPLTLAAWQGHTNLAQELLRSPQTLVNAVDRGGWSALIRAAKHGQEATVALLLAYPEVEVNLLNGDGWSALIWAAVNGHENIVRLLLEHPAIQVNSGSWSALIAAAAYGHEGIVKLLVSHPGIDSYLISIQGWSALTAAARFGHQGILKLLLAFPGIRVNLVNMFGWSALMVAAREGGKHVVDLLLAHPEIQVNLVDINGWSALMVAAAFGKEGAIQSLLAVPGIEVNLVDGCGWSALMSTTNGGHKGAAALLLAYPGIDASIKGREGVSALTLAIDSGHQDIVSLLLDVLASPSQWIIA